MKPSDLEGGIRKLLDEYFDDNSGADHSLLVLSAGQVMTAVISDLVTRHHEELAHKTWNDAHDLGN